MEREGTTNQKSAQKAVLGRAKGLSLRPTRQKHQKLDKRLMRQIRAKIKGEVEYDLYIHLMEPSDTFKGTVLMEFEVNEAPEIEFIYFSFSGKIISITINDTSQSPPQVSDTTSYLIPVPASRLSTKSKNRIFVEFESFYCSSNQGVYRIKDNSTHELFYFVKGEHFNMNRVFPNFDQPNIRNHYKLTLEAPSRIKRAFSMATPTIESPKPGTNEGYSIWTFDRTEHPIQSYLIFFNAGNFAHLQSIDQSPQETSESAQNPKKANNEIYCLPELAAAYRQDRGLIELLSTFTDHCLQFYIDLYGPYPYPLPYRHFFHPSDIHYSVALETPSHVPIDDYFFEDSFYHRTKGLFIIAHEMVHMWIGDSKGVEWWGELWLKEGFADFGAFLALKAWNEKNEVGGDSGLLDAEIFWERRRLDGFEADRANSTRFGGGGDSGRKMSISKDWVDGVEHGGDCYGDEIYGKSCVVIREFFGWFGDGADKEYYKAALTKFKDGVETEEDFLEVVSGLEAVKNAGWTSEGVRKLFLEYFKDPYFSKIVMTETEDELVFTSDRMQRRSFEVLAITAGAENSIEGFRVDLINKTESRVSKEPSSPDCDTFYLIDPDSNTYAAYDQDFERLVQFLLKINFSEEKTKGGLIDVNLTRRLRLKTLFNILCSQSTKITEETFKGLILALIEDRATRKSLSYWMDQAFSFCISRGFEASLSTEIAQKILKHHSLDLEGLIQSKGARNSFPSCFDYYRVYTYEPHSFDPAAVIKLTSKLFDFLRSDLSEQRAGYNHYFVERYLDGLLPLLRRNEQPVRALEDQIEQLFKIVTGFDLKELRELAGRFNPDLVFGELRDMNRVYYALRRYGVPKSGGGATAGNNGENSCDLEAIRRGIVKDNRRMVKRIDRGLFSEIGQLGAFFE